MPQIRSIPPLTALASAGLALLCSCATVPEAGQSAEAASAPGEAASATAAAAPASGASAAALRPGLVVARPGVAHPAPPGGASLPPFATVTQGARRVEGMLTLWQKEDKVWLELRPEDFNKPMFFSPKISQGLGEGGDRKSTRLNSSH